MSLSMIDLNKTRVTNLFGDCHGDHPMEWFWRVESSYYWGEEGCVPSIHFERWAVYRPTKRGVWLIPYEMRNPHFSFQHRHCEDKKKLVIYGTNRAWAYPTKALAWNSFLIRQVRRVQHCKNALVAADAIKALAAEVEPEI